MATGTRFNRRCHKPEAAESRPAMEAKEWTRWRRRLAFLLREMNAPALQTVSNCMDKEMAMQGLAGRTRLNTVRSYVRAIETLRGWLLRAHQLPFPTSAVNFVDCVHARAAEACGPTAPGQVVRALTWIERAAAIPDGDRMSEKHEVQQVIANTEMHFGTRKGADDEGAALPQCLHRGLG